MSNNYYKAVSIHQIFDKNPFINGLGTESKLKKKNIMVGHTSNILLNKDTGEIEGHTVIMKSETKDTEQFIKFYMENLKLFFSLSQRSMKVLAYVMSVTRANNDTVYFDMEDCKDYTGIASKTTVISGLSELISNEFLAVSSKKYLYFINPSIFFNGNRVSFIKTAIRQTTSGNQKTMSELKMLE